ncbi:hypothetical protein [Synechococcus sp. R70.1]|uniref:hypothetical protein n=1 Tax=Synechococcus sp. R70.1 TaxID=2964531 RepID=UPI0039C03595
MSDNRLSGPIPPELAQLKQLRDLRRARNQLTGKLPSFLAELPRLERLHIGGNPGLCLPAVLSSWFAALSEGDPAPTFPCP